MTNYDGYEWAMRLCLNGYDPIIEERFSSKSAAEDWLREHHPSFFAAGVWYGEDKGGTWFQYGTDYFWAQFQLAPRPSATLGPEDDQEVAPD